VERLAAEVRDGLSAAELRAGVADLEANGPLFQLKGGCLAYCRFVHHHHRLEDVAFFPALRRSEPQAAPVIDRLEREHVEVATLLAEVEAAAAALGADERTRGAVADALESLGEKLLAHLEYEEQGIGPTIRRLRAL
jgi:iron-sulfur cluster repair protein YtfE (RIC family)